MKFFSLSRISLRAKFTLFSWVSLTAIVIHYNACSGGFQAQELSSELHTGFSTGQALFKTNCSTCHSDSKFFSSRKLPQQKMEELIYYAFDKVPAMGGVKSKLSSQDVRYISEYLSTTHAPGVCTSEIARVTSHRLNRREYENTLRDLTGLPLNVAARFPEDPIAVGFDNNAASLTITPTTGEIYLNVAEEVAAELFAKNKSRVVQCTPTSSNINDCARASLSQFGRLAFRRPLRAPEIDAYLKIFQTVRSASLDQSLNASFDEGMKAVVTAFLISPQFLYRTVTITNNKSSQSVEALDAYELASRMSYFIWSTMPDNTLLDLAASGRLLDEKVLESRSHEC